MKNKDEYDVFICYSSRDIRWVTKFVGDLTSHFIKPWIDELEVKIGYPVRATIERGIEQSRFFCLIISNSSMKSYYVRKVELEAAFTKMFERKKDSLILPVILRKPPRKLPLMLRQLHYLDFTKKTQYVHNLLEFVKRVRLGDTKFTGSLWYKGLDVSSFGMLLGVGRLGHKSFSGYCTEIHFEEGQATSLEMYVDGRLNCHKKIHYKNNKVIMIEQFRSNRRTEKLVYSYSRAGRRLRKQWFGKKEHPWLEAQYNRQGKKHIEQFLKSDGSLDDSRGYAFKEYRYNNDGELITVQYRNKKRNLIRSEHIQKSL